MKTSRISRGKTSFLLFTAAITCVALPSQRATAHEGDRVVPIPEITDDMLAPIDLRDGTTDEWPDLLGRAETEDDRFRNG